MAGFFIQVPDVELLLSGIIQCLRFPLPPPGVGLEAQKFIHIQMFPIIFPRNSSPVPAQFVELFRLFVGFLIVLPAANGNFGPILH